MMTFWYFFPNLNCMHNVKTYPLWRIQIVAAAAFPFFMRLRLIKLPVYRKGRIFQLFSWPPAEAGVIIYPWGVAIYFFVSLQKF